MPPLSNARHERFAQALASGKSATEAMAEVGYSDPRNSTKLTKRYEIRARVDEILAVAAEKVAVTKSRVLDELGKIAFANMLDYIRIGDDGQPYTDFSALTRDQAAAIGEVVVEMRTEYETGEDGEKTAVPVRKVRFKLSDKRSALVDIGKDLGMFKERIEHTGKDGKDLIPEVTDDQRAKALALFLTKHKT